MIRFLAAMALLGGLLGTGCGGTAPEQTSLEDLIPPTLAWDFYPRGMTRQDLRARLTEAIGKTGEIAQNETWEGVIRITGDLRILKGMTVTIEPGTLILVATGSDDQQGGAAAPADDFNPRDPVRDDPYVKSRVEMTVDGSLVAIGSEADPILITSDAFPDWQAFPW